MVHFDKAKILLIQISLVISRNITFLAFQLSQGSVATLLYIYIVCLARLTFNLYNCSNKRKNKVAILSSAVKFVNCLR